MKIWRPQTIGSTIAAVLGLVSVSVGIILGVRQLLPKPTTPRMSVVFVLDVSPAMQKPFGGTTKLAMAEQNIVNYAHQFPGVPTALRLAGGNCGAGYQPP